LDGGSIHAKVGCQAFLAERDGFPDELEHVARDDASAGCSAVLWHIDPNAYWWSAFPLMKPPRGLGTAINAYCG
jgi:hypothetical protein